MDAQHLTFADNSFDFVDAWGCLMHMPDTEGAIKEMYRVTRPGGRALAYMYNKSSWPYWFNIIFVRGVLMLGLLRFKGDTVRLTSRYSDGYSLGGNMLTKFYTPNEVGNMFRDAGFKHVVSKPWEIPHEADHWPMRSVPLFKYVPTPVKHWLSQFGYGLIITAEK
jgi:demethylmenaquinone methyltransferase/2-methoxy-6-polyprenyl-1,4-benzoquinol methylase